MVRPLRTLGTVVADLIGPMPYVELQQLLDGLWTPGSANYFTSAFIESVPDDAVATFTDFHRRSADLPVQAELHLAPPRRRHGSCPLRRHRLHGSHVAVHRQLPRSDS